MIVTVKLGNLEYKTLAIELGLTQLKTDQELLDHINKLIRLELWESFTTEQYRRYSGDIRNLEFAIVMMYSQNRDSITD